MQTQSLVADLVESGSLPLDPLLAGLQSSAAIGQLAFRGSPQLINGLALSGFLCFPSLPVSD
jgi:hypothetical protein